ncbi:hypothetical protein BH23ACT6_BH23ACT6_13750 [soil metagenome]
MSTATITDPAAWRPQGEVFVSQVTESKASLRSAGSICVDAPRFDDGEVRDALRGLNAVSDSALVLIVRVVAEALSRGTNTQVGMGAHDWVARRCPSLPRGHVADVVIVAKGINEPRHGALRTQVEDGQLPVHRAAAVLRALGRVKPLIDGPEYEAGMGLLIDTAVRSSFTDRDLKRACDFLISTILPEKDHEAQARASRDMRGVNESSLADGTYVRFIVTCDPEGAALFRAIMASPLAAPDSTHADAEGMNRCGSDNASDVENLAQAGNVEAGNVEAGKDARTATQRRYDAVMTVLRRGVAGGKQTPTTPKAAVQVTISWDVLLAELTGTGTTTTGEVLSPETVRKMACDADLIPIVLGTDNEILNMGRTKRLVTPGQRRVLGHRDQHCSFPGCSTPAPWCDAHHVIHWCRGGLSDIPNYVLLCGRHHTLVHERDLTASVTTTGVRWHV